VLFGEHRHDPAPGVPGLREAVEDDGGAFAPDHVMKPDAVDLGGAVLEPLRDGGAWPILGGGAARASGAASQQDE